MANLNSNRWVTNLKAFGKQHGRKTLIAILVITVLLLLSDQLSSQGEQIAGFIQWVKESYGWKGALIGGLIYAVLLSIPFFPGVELAWLIILFYGKDSVGLIYVTTLLGLTISFSAGRWFRGATPSLSRGRMEGLEETYNKAFDRLSEKIHGLFSTQQCSLWLNRLLRKTHYLVLAILINIPGNSVFGGGGGIAFLSGMNRSFSLKGFLITLAVAISPLPILLYFGLVQVEKLLMQ